MKTAFLFTVLICCAFFSLAQKNSLTEIVYEDGTQNSPISKIIFRDSIGNIKGEFDTQANNPFKLVKGSLYEKGSDGDILKIDDPIQAQSSVSRSSSSAISTDVQREVNLKYSKVIVDAMKNQEKEIKGVVYNLRLYNENLEERGSKAQFQILDDKGEIIKKIDLDTDTRSTAISNDENYIGYNFGGEVDHNGFKVFDEGIGIYDIESGQKIFQMFTDQGYIASLPRARHDLLVFVFHGQDRKFIIVKPEKRICYIKVYTKEEKSRLKTIGKEGLYFDHIGGEHFDSYEEVFIKNLF
jgi:hypothetical protein